MNFSHLEPGIMNETLDLAYALNRGSLGGQPADYQAVGRLVLEIARYAWNRYLYDLTRQARV